MSVPGGFWEYPSPDSYENNSSTNQIAETVRNSEVSERRVRYADEVVVDVGNKDDEAKDIPPRPQPLHFDESVYEPAQILTPSSFFQFSTQTLLPLLYGKNLVVKLPQSNRILKLIDQKFHGNQRLTHLKYTACTADPDNFTVSEYRLDIERDQSTEIMICMTMYNEDSDLFLKSFRAVRKNIQFLLQEWSGSSTPTSSTGWKRVVFCIIADGRAKMNEKTLALMGVLGIYQSGLVTSKVQDANVTAHIFETTCTVGYSSYNNDVVPGICPVQIIFCLKEQNAKKINSRKSFRAKPSIHQLIQ